VTVPIPLTHVNIARLIGAQRPTVTTSLNKLLADGQLAHEGGGYRSPLTHADVARLIGAQRPTVTTAIRALVDYGLLTSEGRGHWLLHGEPPAQLPVHHHLPD
jgi:Mn-dependent DtxR family transcriptional regulator